MVFKDNKELRKREFKNEKELQTYFEENLENILKLKFVETEFKVDNYRIDTVAFDEEVKAFRIIEFKNIKNRSLVDQGYTYLKILHERKADFVLRFNEKAKANLKIEDVDWSQSRIIFVSPSFTGYQLDATSFETLPFDLYKVNKYEGNIILIESVKKTSSVKLEDVNASFENKILKEIKVYTEEEHLKNKSEKIIEIYSRLKEDILKIGDISIDAKKYYIAFKGITNIVDIEIQQKILRININLKSGEIEDPKELAINQAERGHWGNGDYRADISNLDELDYIIYLIKQSYEKNK